MRATKPAFFFAYIADTLVSPHQFLKQFYLSLKNCDPRLLNSFWEFISNELPLIFKN